MVIVDSQNLYSFAPLSVSVHSWEQFGGEAGRKHIVTDKVRRPRIDLQWD